MRALLFRPGPVRRRVASLLGPALDVVRWGPAAGLFLTEVDEPDLPGRGWARLEVLLAGIGLSELRDLTYAASPLEEPLSSWPAVPGREILGRIVEAASGWSGPPVGARVAVDPFLSCAARGWADQPCPACVVDRTWACHRAGDEGAVRVDGRLLRRGRRLGAHADLPGGWTRRILAHESQLVPVAEALPDRVAVLLEPAARALEAVVRSQGAVPGSGPDLVLGGTAEALLTVLVLASSRPETAVAHHAPADAARALGRRLGATHAPTDADELRDATVETGASAHMSLDAREVWWGGGFRRVFDWRAGSDGRTHPVARTRPGGAVVPGPGVRADGEVVALAADRGVTLVGAGSHAPRAAYRPAAALLEAHAAVLADVATHVYPLHQRREALALAERPSDDTVKVLFDPGA